MLKLFRLLHLAQLAWKWLPIFIELINNEDDKDNPNKPYNENQFQHKAVSLILPKLGLGQYEALTNAIIDRTEWLAKSVSKTAKEEFDEYLERFRSRLQERS